MEPLRIEAKEPRILLWDIETSHDIVAVFELKNNDWIRPENILQERYVISASWKWLGEKTIHSVSVLDDPQRYEKNPNDDFHVIKTLHEVLSSADAIVHHNGNAFDNKFVEGRILFHNFTPLPPIPHIDTLRVAKTRFLLNSNSLDYLGGYLKVGHKLEHTNGLWLRALKGGADGEKAIRKMVQYNKHDITLLEGVFMKLRPYMPDYINRQLFGGDGICPRCGSIKIKRMEVHRAITQVYERFQCQECFGWFRTKKSSGSAPHRVL